MGVTCRLSDPAASLGVHDWVVVLVWMEVSVHHRCRLLPCSFRWSRRCLHSSSRLGSDQCG
ncbi:hypothetical protein ANCDUO_03738 [Ancylostoma duodenale]|uniref:Uncharacterized protein n=1 Tax=Ancylostoma duodenale TaxID=51022 RepID=A0A0C2H340_9BILA|nr:hypothetical protein ANCDUO_03738 [Ancylostoma duodenale]